MINFGVFRRLDVITQHYRRDRSGTKFHYPHKLSLCRTGLALGVMDSSFFELDLR